MATKAHHTIHTNQTGKTYVSSQVPSTSLLLITAVEPLDANCNTSVHLRNLRLLEDSLHKLRRTPVYHRKLR
ncbi:hypothetical protein DPMN_106641 [Dreissena polymorpha]|uniref:Uncharacterized protein n=1 Tax=Dreissena polymorpha TaxID=45954 RepID=A0A9D4K5I4_DREPO|nr:hypothetical protein DPMN_106641 [Dreissena polymorpha]